MGENISSHVDEELNQLIESVAEYHNIPKSRAIELLLREGAHAWEMRLRFEQLDAKLDVLLNNLGGGADATEEVTERLETVMDRGLPGGTTGVDLADQPHPYFLSESELLDRPDDLALESVLAERDSIERGERSGADD